MHLYEEWKREFLKRNKNAQFIASFTLNDILVGQVYSNNLFIFQPTAMPLSESSIKKLINTYLESVKKRKMGHFFLPIHFNNEWILFAIHKEENKYYLILPTSFKSSEELTSIPTRILYEGNSLDLQTSLNYSQELIDKSEITPKSTRPHLYRKNDNEKMNPYSRHKKIAWGSIIAGVAAAVTMTLLIIFFAPAELGLIAAIVSGLTVGTVLTSLVLATCYIRDLIQTKKQPKIILEKPDIDSPSPSAGAEVKPTSTPFISHYTMTRRMIELLQPSTSLDNKNREELQTELNDTISNCDINFLNALRNDIIQGRERQVTLPFFDQKTKNVIPKFGESFDSFNPKK